MTTTIHLESSYTEVELHEDTGTIVIRTQGGDEGVASVSAREFMQIISIVTNFMAENMHDPE